MRLLSCKIRIIFFVIKTLHTINNVGSVAPSKSLYPDCKLLSGILEQCGQRGQLSTHYGTFLLYVTGCRFAGTHLLATRGSTLLLGEAIMTALPRALMVEEIDGDGLMHVSFYLSSFLLEAVSFYSEDF
ncbi:hypothetical protein AVEN_248432-1 [Araneus ventricosus]|uniref:Uncharacterized protein n=1 Tax=Araneus ventricosus TaxID=182803 RepID=A0A4Y2WT64_ARAVE|nr:hypothetical protein AVEN_248432-1 [Araneus ventricosus]